VGRDSIRKSLECAFAAAVCANDDGGDSAVVQDNGVQNQDLNMHKSYCKYRLQKGPFAR
jgi:hypothetical protein